MAITVGDFNQLMFRVNYIRCFNPSVHQVFFYRGIQQRPGMEGHIGPMTGSKFEMNTLDPDLHRVLQANWPLFAMDHCLTHLMEIISFMAQEVRFGIDSTAWLMVSSQQWSMSIFPFFWGGTSPSYHFSEHTPDEKDWITASICFWHASIVHVLQIYQMWGSKHIKTIQCHIELQRNR